MLCERTNPANERTLILWSGVLSPFELVLLGRGVGKKGRGLGKAATVLKLWTKMRPPFSCPAGCKDQTFQDFLLHLCKLRPWYLKF
jgi:hypothetical protein